jgi:hypothetical protein
MNARTLVRIDALFELALGLALVAGTAAGALDGGDFPHPVGRVVILVAGCLLLVLGVALWLGVAGPAALAVGNTVTAAAAVIWLLVASGFSGTGIALVALAAAGLVFLALGQATSLRV